MDKACELCIHQNLVLELDISFVAVFQKGLPTIGILLQNSGRVPGIPLPTRQLWVDIPQDLLKGLETQWVAEDSKDCVVIFLSFTSKHLVPFACCFGHAQGLSLSSCPECPQQINRKEHCGTVFCGILHTSIVSQKRTKALDSVHARQRAKLQKFCSNSTLQVVFSTKTPTLSPSKISRNNTGMQQSYL